MTSFLLYCVLGYIALAVQAVFFKGIKPDFILVLICVYSVKYGYAKGVAYGALNGLIIDTASGFILGPNIISKAVIGFIARSIRENIFNWNIVVNTVVVAVLTVLDIFIVYMCHKTFSGILFDNRPWTVPVLETVITAAASLLMYGLLSPEKDGSGNIQ
ncbi:MAG: rod shape-determining protein MreD [Nitrospirota bacterium]|nr:rod shape-determining protein MreD [Nitrospirota bacterium]